MSKAIKTSSYRESLLESLKDPEEAREYLNAAIEDSRESFLKALRNVAQANNMAKVAKEAGVQRETLYRSLSENGNPTLESLLGVLGAVGLQFCVAPLGKIESDPPEPEPPNTASVGTNGTIAAFASIAANQEVFGPMKIAVPHLAYVNTQGIVSQVSVLPGFYRQVIVPGINEESVE